MPVYNERRYLDTVISKLIVQPLPCGFELELILVNDASKDTTWDIMQSVLQKFLGIRFPLINKKVNEGKSAALRDGFTRVTGDIVLSRCRF
jgi:glycosyltransferase involved in cell wall biosynthesis